MSDKIALEKRYGATNYAPLPVVLARGEGVWLWDDEGRRYLDMLSAYSAVSFGYGHPKLLATLTEQAARLAVTSRAFYSDTLPPFLEKLCEITGMDRALPMSTGAEGVETAIKCSRKWAYTVKNVPDGMAEIIVCADNFHGRTSTIVGFSSESQYRDGFGPYSGGFVH
ncbi:MAG: aminotransferase class III-fold pyridoxal phosphate-dependent enzyme, partial [Usitatibacter sp.]